MLIDLLESSKAIGLCPTGMSIKMLYVVILAHINIAFHQLLLIGLYGQ